MTIQDERYKELKGNFNKSLLAISSVGNRTTTVTSSTFTNIYHTGAHISADVTVVPGTDTVTFSLEAKDAVSGKYYTVVSSAALVATGLVVLKVYPGITAVADISVSDFLPLYYRIRVVHSGNGGFTYSVGLSLI